MIACHKCGKTFKTERGLRLHSVRMHQTKETNMENKTETESTKANTVLSPEEKGILDRVTSQDTSWFTIREDELEDFSLQINPMDLKDSYPKAWRLQVEKQYAFRWCTRTPQRIDELTRSVSPPLRWALVTRTTLADLQEYIDPILGCIACLDQVLLFKPWAHHEIVKRAKADMAEAKARSGGMDAVKAQRNDDKVKSYTGAEYKIDGRDDVQYEDTRGSFDESDIGDLVLEE